MNSRQRRQLERTQAASKSAPTFAIDNLSEKQWAERLVSALAAGGPFTEEDGERAMEWVNKIKVDLALLELVAHGMVAMRWDKEQNDWHFRRSSDPSAIHETFVEKMGRK